MKKKLGIAYSVTGNYILKTLPSVVSVLENNRNAIEEEKVDIVLYFYILNEDEEQIKKLKEICETYNVSLKIIKAEKYIDSLEKAGDLEYNDSLIIDIFLIAPSTLDVDYNILFLQSDVVMNRNQNLYFLANFDFEKGKKSCASTIDPQSSPIIKKIIPLKKDEHIFNCGVFLVSPYLYKKHSVFEKYTQSISEKGWKFYPYWNVLRNAYGLRDELCVLPVKYQIYPSQKMISIKQFLKLFDMDIEQYYSMEELKNAIDAPVFIHYINHIVKKPWFDYLPRRYRRQGTWPFQDVWNEYADILGIREELMEIWDKSFFEKVKDFFFDYIMWAYIPLCRYFYLQEVKKRNRIISMLTESDKGKIYKS